MRSITLMQTHEYCDVPQIIFALDVMSMKCFCTLFNHSEESGFENIGIQVSESCFISFVGGQLDLRDEYLHPKTENAVCHVTAKDETITVTKSIQQQDITEIMLPKVGYFYDASELVNDKNPPLDNNQCEVYVHDRITFSTLVTRMGLWALSFCKTTVS